MRNSHALASSLPYVLTSDSYDARCYVRGVANQGFSGLLWTPEVRDAGSIEDLYRRCETVMFSSDAVINSWFIKNPPWDQGQPREKTITTSSCPNACRHHRWPAQIAATARMSFIPYLYSAFNEYHRTGKPLPIRALVLDWPKDPKVRQLDDQFMFGDSVLVAPIFAGETHRQVYLPAGEWHDFWTHAKIHGGTTIEATNWRGSNSLVRKRRHPASAGRNRSNTSSPTLVSRSPSMSSATNPPTSPCMKTTACPMPTPRAKRESSATACRRGSPFCPAHG